jgi:hypothetical protein
MTFCPYMESTEYHDCVFVPMYLFLLDDVTFLFWMVLLLTDLIYMQFPLRKG